MHISHQESPHKSLDAREDLLNLIISYIVETYTGRLQKLPSRDNYVPLDRFDINGSLSLRWGGRRRRGMRVNRDVIDEAFKRLTETGAPYWPKVQPDRSRRDRAVTGGAR
jgi:hypothetical protein